MSQHRVGVLLVNLGSPEQPREDDVRRFLAQFLGDPDVVQANRAVWWVVLHGLILPRRSRAAAALYERIWSDRGSPLRTHSVVPPCPSPCARGFVNIGRTSRDIGIC